MPGMEDALRIKGVDDDAEDFRFLRNFWLSCLTPQRDNCNVEISAPRVTRDHQNLKIHTEDTNQCSKIQPLTLGQNAKTRGPIPNLRIDKHNGICVVHVYKNLTI